MSRPRRAQQADHSEGMSFLSTLPHRVRAHLHAAFADRRRAAVPVLLDGDDGDQAEGASARPRRAQPLLYARRRPSSTSTTCSSRPTTRSGCGTRCSSRSSATVAVADRQRVRGLRDHAHPLQRRASGSAAAIFLAYLVPPSILFIPLSTVVFQYGLFDTPFALILTYPTILIPFSTWLLMGYFKTIPYELEECALIDGATRWQILTKIVLPLAVPGLISAAIFCLHAVLERVHLRADLHQHHREEDGARRPSCRPSPTATSTAGAR